MLEPSEKRVSCILKPMDKVPKLIRTAITAAVVGGIAVTALLAQGDLATTRHAAERGNAEEQLSLGLMNDQGQGVIEDDIEAVRWYRLAAEQGLDAAQYQLGVMYTEGRGILKDEAAAVRWHRRAAEQNYDTAPYALGVMYTFGWGVLKDPVLAHMWFNIAGAYGNEMASPDYS